MSFWLGIGSGVAALIGVGSNVSAAVTTLVNGRNSENRSERNALIAASYFLGFSIVFALGTIVAAVYLSSVKCGKKKKSKILFIIVFVLLALCVITGTIIVAVIRARRRNSGVGDVTALSAVLGLMVGSLIAYLISFILILIVISKKNKILNRTCKQYVRN